jgi:hypothetical protein
MIQEILYNNKLTNEETIRLRGALHELDQLILLPQTAEVQQKVVEQQKSDNKHFN